jgi:hypothetical protein
MRYSMTDGFHLDVFKKNETPLSQYSMSLRDSILVSPDCYLEALEPEQDKFATLTAK